MNKKLIVEVFRNSGLKAVLDHANVPDGMMMVEGVLGRVDSENRNKRSYPREEYAKHINLMQERINESNGIFGEMEHPKSMNIDLNNVSHKVVDVRLDEDGFVRGRVLLLDTPKGKIAQSIVKSGSPLPISSRAVGQVSESGVVTLDLLSTYDLVGTAGFAEAKLGKALTESLDENGNIVCETYVSDIDDNGDVVQESTLRTIVETVEERLKKSFVHKDEIDSLVEQRVAAQGGAVINENNDAVVGLTEAQALVLMNEQFSNVYSPILEKWITTQFAPKFGDVVQEWLSNDYANLLETWVKEDVLPHHSRVIENWMKEDVLPHNAEVTENWLQNTLLPHNAEVTENWIRADFAPKFGELVQEWLTGDYANVLESWVKGQVNESTQLTETKKEDVEDVKEEEAEKSKEETPKKEEVKESINDHADLFVSKLLKNINEDVEKAKDIKAEEKEEEKIDEAFYRTAPSWLKRIPSEFKPMWQGLNENQREKVFKRAAVRLLETEEDVRRFWKGIDFETIIEGDQRSIKRNINETVDAPVRTARHGIGAYAKALQGRRF